MLWFRCQRSDGKVSIFQPYCPFNITVTLLTVAFCSQHASVGGWSEARLTMKVLWPHQDHQLFPCISCAFTYLVKSKQVTETNLPPSVMRRKSFPNKVADEVLSFSFGNLGGILESALELSWALVSKSAQFLFFALVSLSLCSTELDRLALNQQHHFSGFS